MLRRTSPRTRGGSFASRNARGFQVDKEVELLACSLAAPFWGSLLRDGTEDEGFSTGESPGEWTSTLWVTAGVASVPRLTAAVETVLSGLPVGTAEHSVRLRPLRETSERSPSADDGPHSVDRPLARPLLRELLHSPTGRPLA